MENLQNLDPWVWVAVAIGMLFVIGVVVALSKKRKWDHARAEAMRSKVEEELPELRRQEASALETEAQAERARADAERLEAQAREQRDEVEDHRTKLTERLEEADARDPLVDSDADEHRHVDGSARPD